AGPVPGLLVEQRSDAGFERSRLFVHLLQNALQAGDVSVLRGIRGSLAALELPLEEVERKAGVRLIDGIHAVKRQQVLRARYRILERAIRFVGACRSLEGEPLLRCVRGCVAVRMHFALQGLVGTIERRRFKAETL